MIVIEGITSKGESVGEYLKSKLLRLYYYSWKKPQENMLSNLATAYPKESSLHYIK